MSKQNQTSCIACWVAQASCEWALFCWNSLSPSCCWNFWTMFKYLVLVNISFIKTKGEWQCNCWHYIMSELGTCYGWIYFRRYHSSGWHHAQTTITCIKEELAIITKHYSVPFNPLAILLWHHWCHAWWWCGISGRLDRHIHDCKWFLRICVDNPGVAFVLICAEDDIQCITIALMKDWYCWVSVLYSSPEPHQPHHVGMLISALLVTSKHRKCIISHIHSLEGL